MCALVCLLVCLQVLIGCKGAKPEPVEAIPLPQIGEPGPQRPVGVVGVIRRADVPLDQPTDDAWAIINEQAVPALTRGAWRGNGLRLGVLQRDQLDAYASAMPRPVYYGETLINQSDYDVSIHTTPRLRNDLRFEIDLTRPPRPRAVETIAGGKQSTLRLLARIEDGVDGRYVLVLTPQHHVPKAPGLLVRDPLEKERDGRIYDELTVRLTLDEDQVAVVGLYWPWPEVERLPDEEQARGAPVREGPGSAASPGYDPNDPAAPPPHIAGSGGQTAEEDGASETTDDREDEATDDPLDKPRFERVAPPLPTHFGGTLLTGTRIRQPVRTVLLISIEVPAEEPGATEGETETETEPNQG